MLPNKRTELSVQFQLDLRNGVRYRDTCQLRINKRCAKLAYRILLFARTHSLAAAVS